MICPRSIEEPVVDEEITMAALEVEEELRVVYRRQGMPTQVDVDRDGDSRFLHKDLP